MQQIASGYAKLPAASFHRCLSMHHSAKLQPILGLGPSNINLHGFYSFLVPLPGFFWSIVEGSKGLLDTEK